MSTAGTLESAKTFFAYPSKPQELGEAIIKACGFHNLRESPVTVKPWPQSDIAGKSLSAEILKEIQTSRYLYADITNLNFNVTYEIGYAIGCGIPITLFRNTALATDNERLQEIGIFDTLGYHKYANSEELGRLLEVPNSTSHTLEVAIDTKSPIYLALPDQLTDDEIRLIARVKKSRIRHRSYDPQEQGRLSPTHAIASVAASAGVATILAPASRHNPSIHNMRVAFIAGLATGMGKLLLLMQRGDTPIPLDYRDQVAIYNHTDAIDDLVAEFVPHVYEQVTAPVTYSQSDNQTFLQKVSLYSSAAENEFPTLSSYFVRTDHFERILRGEVQLVVGRKGAGKTALFGQVRDQIRANRQRIVLDLMPDGFQLLKFKELVLDRISEGSKQHVMTAFWEYLLLLEICHKLLDVDQYKSKTDHTISELYSTLLDKYRADNYVPEGDFAERMSQLLDPIGNSLSQEIGTQKSAALLDSKTVTRSIYRHDVPQIRKIVREYLKHKNGLWILFDNLDKGWPPHGLTDLDAISFRALLDAMNKIRDVLRNDGQICNGIVFVRHDVHEWILRESADRGKTATLIVDWSESDLLREIVRQRIVASTKSGDVSFDSLWYQLCCSHVAGEESSQYIIDRSLMRPRSVIDFIQLCRSRALNLSRSKIEEDDIKAAEEAYSNDLVINMGFELRDVMPSLEGILYKFIEGPTWVSTKFVLDTIRELGLRDGDVDKAFDLLIWFGILGVVRDSTEVTYIYSVGYNFDRIMAVAKRAGGGDAVLCFNPCLWAALELKS
jgi:hypothetical protein